MSDYSEFHTISADDMRRRAEEDYNAAIEEGADPRLLRYGHLIAAQVIGELIERGNR